MKYSGSVCAIVAIHYQSASSSPQKGHIAASCDDWLFKYGGTCRLKRDQGVRSLEQNGRSACNISHEAASVTRSVVSSFVREDSHFKILFELRDWIFLPASKAHQRSQE